MNAFIEGRYIFTFVGTTSGVIICDSVKGFRSTVEDLFPNPGDPIKVNLLSPARWQELPEDGMPFYIEVPFHNGSEDYVVRVYRECELVS